MPRARARGPAAARLELDEVTKVFADGTVAVDALSLRVADGELVALLGGPGSGKTVTLELVAGLEDITLGELRLDGVVVNDRPPRGRDVAMVFSSHALYPHLTVAENLAFPLVLAGVPAAEITRRVEETSRELGISAHLDRRPAHLAAGQRRRVALGRAVIRQPGVLLLDEPLSDLDPRLQGAMRALVAELHQTRSLTTLMATEDPGEASRLADRVVVLDDGVVHQIGTPEELVEAPASLLVAGLVGEPAMNLLPGILEGGRLVTGLTTFDLPVHLAAAATRATAAEVVLGVRPDAFSGGGAEDRPDRLEVVVAVDLVERAGSGLDVFFTVPEPGRAWGGVPATARLAEPAPVRAGERARLWLDPAGLQLFDAASGVNLSLGGAPPA